MIIPTIISISQDAIHSVRRDFREGSLALGATKWETIQKIVIPTALPGIMTGVTLGMMRAVGETMAIVMLLGNVMKTPSSIFDTGYAMTSIIVNEITESYGLYPDVTSALFGMAVMLLLIEAAFILVNEDHLPKLLGGRQGCIRESLKKDCSFLFPQRPPC